MKHTLPIELPINDCIQQELGDNAERGSKSALTLPTTMVDKSQLACLAD